MMQHSRAEMEVTREGKMMKKGRVGGRWAERYFVLQGPSLKYYLKSTDSDFKDWLVLQGSCKVSSIKEETHKGKKHFVFRITWPEETTHDAADGSKGEEKDEASGGGDHHSSSNSSSGVPTTPTNTGTSMDHHEHEGSNGFEKSHLKRRGSVRGEAMSAAAAAAPSSSSSSIISSSSSSSASGGSGGGTTAGGGKGAARDDATTRRGDSAGKPQTKHSMVGAFKWLFGYSSHSTTHVPEKTLVVSCESYQEAELWIEAINLQVKESGNNASGLPVQPLKNLPLGLAKGKQVPPATRIREVEEWILSSRWRVASVLEGIRIFEQGPPTNADGMTTVVGAGSRHGSMAVPPVSESTAAASGETIPCFRVNINISASSLEVLNGIWDFSNSMLTPICKAGTIKQMRVVETINTYTDIIHIVLEPIYVYPTWTAPRDMCLIRYCKQNSDKSYVVCMDSTFHQDCPLVSGHVRAELHAAYLIAPPKDNKVAEEEGEHDECLLTFIAQMDPRGWITRYFGYQDAMLQQFMLHVLDVRDSHDIERFVQVRFDPETERKRSSSTMNFANSSGGAIGGGGGATGAVGSVGTLPTPTLPAEMWGEPDASSFRVRGRTYNLDKNKVASAPSLFKLVAIDFFEVPEPTQNISSHPRNRVYQALQRGEDAWLFVMNIMVPGPPFLSFVAYWVGDKKLIEEDTPFGRIARPFFFGNDDEFRNNRFKLIPKVVDGNMIIKMAVKDTPTLLGNKLKQYYYKGDNYFELDVDVGSSSVARHVVGLAIGYAKSIHVDMGLCLQGNDENELPEVLIAACSCINVDVKHVKKL